LTASLGRLVFEEVTIAETTQKCGLVSHLENLLDIMKLEAAFAHIILGV